MRPVIDDTPLHGPDDGQHVWLVLDDRIVHGAVQTREELDLEIALECPVPHPLPHRGMLEYMADEGIVRRPGALTAADPAPNAVRFAAAGPTQLLLATRLLHAEVEVPVIVHRADGGRFETRSRGLSETGARLRFESAFGAWPVVGERLKLTIFLTRLGEPVSTSSVVVGITDEGCLDVHHTELDRENMEELGLQLFARLIGQRHAATDARR